MCVLGEDTGVSSLLAGEPDLQAVTPAEFFVVLLFGEDEMMIVVFAMLVVSVIIVKIAVVSDDDGSDADHDVELSADW